MTTLYEFLIDEVFIGFLQQSSVMLEAISHFKGDIHIVDNQLVFTLPALFELTCDQFNKTHHPSVSSNRTNYLVFRKQLYSHPTNTRLKNSGGNVIVGVTNKDLDHSTYKLTHI